MYLESRIGRTMNHNKNITMKELPLSERPYERCMLYGPEVLSDAELLGIILRNGTRDLTSVDLARHVLDAHPVYKGIIGLNYLNINDLTKIFGIGKVKAIQLICIAEASKRMSKITYKKNISFNSPKSIADYFMESLRHLCKEEIHMLLFDTKHQLIKELTIALGTINSATTSPRELFVEAFRYEAVYLVLLHNHPSGDPTPSKEDIHLTKRVKEAGELLGIILSDHIIIGDNCYISLHERGMM